MLACIHTLFWGCHSYPRKVRKEKEKDVRSCPCFFIESKRPWELGYGVLASQFFIHGKLYSSTVVVGASIMFMHMCYPLCSCYGKSFDLEGEL
jgi:hypothetical protein